MSYFRQAMATNPDDGFRYKIKPKFKYTFKISDGVKVEPYVSDEMAYSFISNEWVGTELESGFAVKFGDGERYEIKTYYKYIYAFTKNESISLWGLQGKFTF